MILYINQAFDFKQIPNDSVDLILVLNNIQISCKDWIRYIKSCNQLSVFSINNSNIGDISILLTVDNLKHLTIYSEYINSRGYFTLTSCPHLKSQPITLSIDRELNEDETKILYEICISNPYLTLSLVMNHTILPLLPFMYKAYINSENIPDIKGYSIKYLTVKCNYFNPIFYPDNLCNLSIEVDDISAEDLKCITNYVCKSVDRFIINVKNPIKYFDIQCVVDLLSKSSCNLIDIDIKNILCTNDELKLVDAILYSKVSRIYIVNLIQTGTAQQQLISKIHLNAHILSVLLDLDQIDKYIESICERNKRNKNKLRSLYDLSYEYALSHKLEIPLFMQR